MIQPSNNKDRHTIPRWNSLNTALKLGELDAVVPVEINTEYLRPEFEECLLEWKREKNLPLALEIISTKELSGIDYPIEDIVDYAKDRLKGMVTYPELLGEFVFTPKKYSNRFKIVIADICQLRHTLISNPRNPLLWVELGRAYLISGNKVKSEKALRTAYGLAPENRTVLRAIARLYAHEREFGKANFYLNSSNRIKKDPWLLSAEIAICNEAGKTSKHIKAAEKLLDNRNIHPYALSELASELATMDFYAANSKKGKRKLEIILPGTHENAVAQIVWLNDIYRIPSIIERIIKPECNYEAESRIQCYNGNWQAAEKYAKDWQDYQAFSVAPVLMRSYLLCDFLENYTEARIITEQALFANRDNIDLLNNFAYASIEEKELKEAEQAMTRAKGLLKGDINSTLLATEGMLCYRKGLVELGKSKYLKAIELSKSSDNPRYLFELYIHFAREELQAGNDISELLSIIWNSRYERYQNLYKKELIRFGLGKN